MPGVAGFFEKTLGSVTGSLQGRFSAAMLLLLSITIGFASLQIVTEQRISGRLVALDDAEKEIAWAHRYHERMLRLAGASKSFSLSARDAFRAAIEQELAEVTPLDRRRAEELEQVVAISGEKPEIAFISRVREAVAKQAEAHATIDQAQQHFAVIAGKLSSDAQELNDRLDGSGLPGAKETSAAIKRHMVKLLRFAPKLATERDPEHLDRVWKELSVFDAELASINLSAGFSATEVAPAVERFESELSRMAIAVSFLRGAFSAWRNATDEIERDIGEQSQKVSASIVRAREQARAARSDVLEAIETGRRFGLIALAAGVLIWASVSTWLRQTVVRPLNAVIDALAYLAAHQKAPTIPEPKLCELRRLHGTIDVFARGFAQIRAMTANLSKMAALDPLTGAQNRRSLPELFRALVERTNFRSQKISLIVVDVDNFKQLNDSHGHDVGDRVLIEVVSAMRSVLRESDLVGRIGGDEFVLIARGPALTDVGAIVTARLAERVGESETLQAYSTPVTLSIGFVEATSRECDFDSLLKQADIAVYEAKARGRATSVHYCSSIDAKHTQRSAALARIERALEAGQIAPVYQPKVDLATRALCGFEALARWRCPERGLLSPDQFREALEDPEFGARISCCVLERAISDAAVLSRRGVDMRSVAVNATQKQILNDGFAERIQDLCLTHGLSPSFLELEVSEGLFASPLRDRVSTSLERLSRLGVGIAIDDFGAGVTALQQLQDPLVGAVKIDLSLVAHLRRDPKTQAMVDGMVRLSRALGLSVVAEGVENQETLDLLLAMGCDRAQGYLFGRPVPIEDVPDMIDRLTRGAQAPQQPASALIS